MTRLRKMMLEELERRNYSQGTTRCYLHAVADFARYFHRSPDRLRPDHVRQYQAYLFRERKLAASSVTQRLAALRFFFLKTLKKRWGMDETPYPKKVRRLPTVLSQEEVAQLTNSAPTPFYRILLMTLYATGARCAEVARLQLRDIDSQRMVVRYSTNVLTQLGRIRHRSDLMELTVVKGDRWRSIDFKMDLR
jgi:integrase/recombinase XerD